MSDDMESVRASRCRLRNADIVYAFHEDIPWKENSFDSVYIKMLACPVTEQTLSEALRVLKPGGQLLVGIRTVIAPFRQMTGWMRSEQDDELRKLKTREKVLAMMRKSGLTQITWQPTNLFNSVCVGWKPIMPLQD